MVRLGLSIIAAGDNIQIQRIKCVSLLKRLVIFNTFISEFSLHRSGNLGHVESIVDYNVSVSVDPTDMLIETMMSREHIPIGYYCLHVVFTHGSCLSIVSHIIFDASSLSFEENCFFLLCRIGQGCLPYFCQKSLMD